MSLEIHGKRKYKSDPRLDWAFPDRMKRLKVESEKKKALEEAKRIEDEEQDRVGGSAKGENGNGSSPGGTGGSKSVRFYLSYLAQAIELTLEVSPLDRTAI